MNVAPLLIVPNYFIQVSNYESRLLNEEGAILKSANVEYEPRPQYKVKKYLEGEACIGFPNQYAPVMAGGRTFIQSFNQIMEVRGNQLIKVCELPGLPTTNQACFMLKLFSLNDQLHFTDNVNFYKLGEDNKPVYIRRASPYGNLLVSFCNNTIVWYAGDKINVMQPDCSETLLYKLDNSIKSFSFGLGGVAVFHDNPYTKAVVVDLVGMKVFDQTSKFLKQQNVARFLALGYTGLAMENQLLAFLGEEFFLKRDDMWKEW